jgi:ABC-2 type transport system ATP-binding protein
VEEFVAGRRTWDRRRIASQESVVVAGVLEAGDWVRARELHLNVESLSLQEVMVHAAGRASDELPERTNA